MLKMALKTIYCDCSSRKKLFMMDALILLLIFLNDEVYRFLCAALPIEMALVRFMPVKEKAYYVMGLDKKQCRKLLVYRTVVTELAIIFTAVISFPVREVILGNGRGYEGIAMTGLLYMLYEICCIVQFSMYSKNTSFETKLRMVMLGILMAIAVFTSAVIMPDWNNMRIKTKMTVGIVFMTALIVFNFMKWFFVRRASYDEFDSAKAIEFKGMLRE